MAAEDAAEASMPARTMTVMNFVLTDALDHLNAGHQFTRIVGIETTVS
jgi:hypothetical protein